MNVYTMMFAMAADHKEVLLLRKPSTHHNPLFRGRWTAPGGKVEPGETELQCVIRELKEETGMVIPYGWPPPQFILRFSCNCDITENEHEVFVYGCLLPVNDMAIAKGTEKEPVSTFLLSELPETHLQWHVWPLLQLTIGRMKQPR